MNRGPVDAEAKSTIALPSRAVRELNRVLTDRSRGRCLVLGADEHGLAATLEAAGRAVLSASRPEDLPPNPRGNMDTVILRGFLERLDAEPAHAALESVWECVRPGGRMIVVVPNEHFDSVAGAVREFKRRALRRELRFLGRPRLIAEQPFRWLVMRLDKPGGRDLVLSGSNRRRLRITAGLCRGRVVDLGCGPGHLAGILHEGGHEVVAVDMSKTKIEDARARYAGVDFRAGDIFAIDFPESSFDTAVLAEVLEHLPEARGDELLAKANRLLRPGGRLVVSVPNEDCVPHKNHLREFDRKSLRRLLVPYGRTRLIADQPFKWLLMVVEKAS